MKPILILSVVSTLLVRCFSPSNDLSQTNPKPNDPSNRMYNDSKRKFDPEFISHFPVSVGTNVVSIISNEDTDRNNVTFILYEDKISKERIKATKKEFKNKAIATYRSDQECLLVVNRFDTQDGTSKGQRTQISDSAQIDAPCFANMYPIPNFIDYRSGRTGEGLKLPDGFTIYVLEAKSGSFFPKFDLKPNPQMPDEWKNGYSKGIAYSEERSELIHWSVMW